MVNAETSIQAFWLFFLLSLLLRPRIGLSRPRSFQEETRCHWSWLVMVLHKICRGRAYLQLQWPHLPMTASLSSLSPDVFFFHSGGGQGWGWESRKHVGIGEGGETLGFLSHLCHVCSWTSFQIIVLFVFKFVFNVYLVFHDMPKICFYQSSFWAEHVSSFECVSPL